MKQVGKLYRDMHKKLTKNYVPTVQEAIKFIDCWLEFHNSKSCPNDRNMTIKECLNTVQKQDIDKNILNDLMMKTEARTINKHDIQSLLHFYQMFHQIKSIFQIDSIISYHLRIMVYLNHHVLF